MYSTTKNKTIFESSDIMFKTPLTMNITGPSKCGKTSLVSDLLENNEAMMSPIHQKIINCFSQFQPLYDYLETKTKNIEFVKGYLILIK
jgi:hypothetical protein